MELSARYYDGRTSRACEVRLSFAADDTVSLLGEGVSLRWRLSELDIADRLGNTPRSVELPNGGKCEVADNDALDAVLAQRRLAQKGGWLHRLESRWIYVVFAVLITGAFSWGTISHGIPWLAEHAAYALPHSVDRQLGQGTLKVLDRTLFSGSRLDEAHRAVLQQRFKAMTDGLPDANSYRLVFRHSKKVGANAFALPSGIVVVTDALVELSCSDDEVIAVLAHEVGHLEHRHSLRMVMQDSAVALLLATVSGDPFSASTLAAALPTVLVHARYSREFETEADDYAYDFLVSHRIPTQAFADILTRLGGEKETAAAEAFLSSHPGTQQRVQRFRASSPAVNLSPQH